MKKPNIRSIPAFTFFFLPLDSKKKREKLNEEEEKKKKKRRAEIIFT